MADVVVLADEPSTDRVWRRFLPHLRPHRARIAIALTLSLLGTTALVGIAPAIGHGVDSVVAGDRTGLWVAVALVVACTLARLVLMRVAEVRLTAVGERVVRRLRELAVERLAGAPLRFVEAHRTGDLLRRTTEEIAELAQFVRGSMPDLLGIGAGLALTTGMLLLYSWQLTLMLFVLFVPAALLVLRWFGRDADEAFGRQAASEAAMTATFTELTAASETLRVNGATRGRLGRFARANDDVLRLSSRTVAVQNRLEGVALLEGLATAALLLLGVWLVSADVVTVGTVVVFVLATRNLFDGMLGLTELLAELQIARIGVARLLDLLDATTPRRRAAGADVPASGELSAAGIGYAYVPGDDVLHDVSVSFAGGERAGLVGRTGSGKTTLAKLLTGLYQPDRGHVRYGGVDVADLDEAELRRRIVLVPQQVHLVTGTLADNLALVPSEPTRADLDRAIDDLGLREWVDGLDGGLDADVGHRGSRLSAGERQIVGLVRVALIDPAVLVLDEATADIDPQTAARLETAVDRLRADRTLIVIAHRQSTIDRLPRAVEVSEGRVV